MPITRQMENTLITGLAVLAKPKFNKVRWDESEDPRHAYYRLHRYESEADADANVSAEVFGPILERFFKDDDDLPHGEAYWYRVADVDKDDEEGDLSDSASLEARGVQTADIEPAAVTATEVAPKAITPSKLLRPLTSNLIKDYDILETENFSFLQYLTSSGSGTTVPMLDANVVHLHNPTADLMGGSNNKFRLTAPAVDYTLRVETDSLSPVEEGLMYEASCFLQPAVAWDTINTVVLRVMWLTLDSAGDLIALSTTSIGMGAAPVSGSAPFQCQTGVQAPAGAICAGLAVTVTAQSGELVDVYYASPKIRQLPISGDYTDVQKAFVSGAITFGNTAGTSIADVTGTFKKPLQPVKSIECTVQFKNAAAAGQFTVSVQYEDKSNPGVWTDFADAKSLIQVGADGQFTGDFCEIPGPTDSLARYVHLFNFRALVDPNQAGNDLRQRYLKVKVNYV